jgi:hypothetical protein
MVFAALDPAVAQHRIVLWMQVARLMRLGRTLAELEAGLLFSPGEWRAASRHTEFYLTRWCKRSADEPEVFTGSGELGVCTTGEMTWRANVTVITSTSARTVQTWFDFRAR